MKKLIVLYTGLLFSLVMNAQGNTQVDTSYRILWYKGKKLKPNTLLTPARDTVRYDPVKSQVKVSSKSGSGKELDNMLIELNRTPQRMNEMMNRLKAGLPKTVVPYYANIIKQSYTQVQQELTPCLSNTLAIPSATFPKTSAASGGHGPFVSYEPGDQTFDEALEEVLGYYQQHKDEKINFVPTPPRREFSYCTLSDKTMEDRFERDFEQFRKELVGKDHEIFSLYLKLLRHSEFYFDDETKVELIRKLEPVNEMLLKRQHAKGVLLVEQFGNDPYRCWAVFRISLQIDRHLSLVGWYDDHGDGKIISWMIIESATKAWAAMFEKAMEEYDYSIALNFPVLLSMERMAQMHDTENKMPFYKLLKFNRFKLNMHVSSKISVEGGYQLAELNGDNWFSALPDSTGRLTWILIGPLVNKVSMDLMAAEFRGKIDFPYVGTRKWESQLPKIKLDFCNEGKDTLDVYMFYAQNHKETWIFPQPKGATDILIVSGLLGNTFLDVNRIRETKNELQNNPEAIEKLKKDMMARLEQMKKSGTMASVSASQGASINKLAFMAEMQKMTNEMRQGNKQYDPLKFVFKPVPHNHSPVVLQEKINGKELFPQNTATEYAWFHLKLEQDPNCPYEVTF